MPAATETVQQAAVADFCYTPPPAAATARRILVKPNLGYPVGPPVTVGMPVLQAVLTGLRQVNPSAEILIVEGVCSPVPLSEIADRLGVRSLLDEGMQLLDADQLPQAEYPNRLPSPTRFASLWAPQLLTEVDCRITVGTLKQTSLQSSPLISASLKNLYGLLPRDRYKARSSHSRGQLHRPSVPLVLRDVWGCIGHLFDGAVVDGSWRYISPDWKPDRAKAGQWLGQVVWGEDPIAVDRQACRAAQFDEPEYLQTLAQFRQALGVN
ncbi:DUF362 domain-containing protein [Synechococcus elongatus IITB7]|uniref:DUF362 domain-containing protein n=1 Tax=Synechococcus elongatus TaxID=32046 RepID=UPI0030CF314E